MKTQNNLRWPWKEFPQNSSDWEECKNQVREVVDLLMDCLGPDSLISEEEKWNKVMQFVNRIVEPIEPVETISLEEYKKLGDEAINIGDRKRMSKTIQERDLEIIQKEKLTSVFFLERTEKNGFTIKQARLVY